MLSAEQLSRYRRNILLPGIGEAGQARLLQARVLVIGAGGLGSPAAYYLAAAGIGTIGLADYDLVELSNLQRQILHTTADLGLAKTESAARKLRNLNPELKIQIFSSRMDQHNIQAVIRGFDFVIEATDNFESKFLINDACLSAAVAFSHAGIREFEGQTMTVAPGVSACYRCVFLEPPPAGSLPPSAQLGVLGATAGIMGTLQAAETIKVLTGVGSPLHNCLLYCDTRTMDFRKVQVQPNPACPVCRAAREKGSLNP